MNYNIFKSKTFWTVVLMFVVGGGNAIVPVLPASAQAIAMLVLTGLATLFHLDTALRSGATN